MKMAHFQSTWKYSKEVLFRLMCEHQRMSMKFIFVQGEIRRSP